MTAYTVRTNCEYSSTVDADNADEAIELAGRTDLDNWDQAWATAEAERED